MASNLVKAPPVMRGMMTRKNTLSGFRRMYEYICFRNRRTRLMKPPRGRALECPLDDE